MGGIGPFIPHKDTPFAKFPAGSVEQTCFLLSLIRLIKPNILLPSTTALGTIDPNGREKGILAGANVVMPNLSPIAVRKKYSLYDNKICTGDESAQCLKCLNGRLNAIGFQTVTSRGDIKRWIIWRFLNKKKKMHRRGLLMLAKFVSTLSGVWRKISGQQHCYDNFIWRKE